MSVRKRTKKEANNIQKDTKEVNEKTISDTAISDGIRPTFNYKEKILTRFVLVSALLAIVYFTSSKDKRESLATKKETLSRLYQEMPCISRKNNLIAPDDLTCTPERCGRYISDVSLERYEVDLLISMMKGEIERLSPQGDFALDIFNGKIYESVQTQRLNLLPQKQNELTFKLLWTKLKGIISEEFRIAKSHIEITSPSLFIYQSPASNGLKRNETWNLVIVYLNTIDSSFSGGRLVFTDGDRVHRDVEPKAGRVTIMTVGHENSHFVQDVTAGQRYTLVMSFSCEKEAAHRVQ